MPLDILCADISTLAVDAIVNPSDPVHSGSGGTDHCIQNAGGPELRLACQELERLRPGTAQITEGYRLPCRYVIHTAAPRWKGGFSNEHATLLSCYRSCLELAEQHGCRSIAFPVLAAGTLAFPKVQALTAATDVMRDYLRHHDMQITLVVHDRKLFDISRRLYEDVQHYVDQSMSPPADFAPRMARPFRDLSERCVCNAPAPAESLEQRLQMLDESFSQMLLRKIDERGMSDAECYKRANIDKRLFSKIRSQADYRPTKPTVLAFAVALRMTLDETEALLRCAGFSLSHSSKLDVIVEFFISREMYDIFEINNTLFKFDQSLLGSR